MKYSENAQREALNYLIKNSPHDINKFEKLYKVEYDEDCRPQISLYNIMLNDIWSVEEKVRLIKLYGWETSIDVSSIFFTFDEEIEEMPFIDVCIKQKNIAGFKALLNSGAHISVASIERIVKYVKSPKKRYEFCEAVVAHYLNNDQDKPFLAICEDGDLMEIPSLCDRYPVYIRKICTEFEEIRENISSMESICSTNDLSLINLFLPTVKNINPLFIYAIKTGNIEIIQRFLEEKANINFQDTDVKVFEDKQFFKPSLIAAIDENNLNLIQYLFQNGANLNFVKKTDEIKNFVKEPDEYEDAISRTRTVFPNQMDLFLEDQRENEETLYYYGHTALNYAIHIGPASIIEKEVVNNTTKRSEEPKQKQLNDRTSIVDYLYMNGATFEDGTIHFTDLIAFFIVAKNLYLSKFYFYEAQRVGYKLDFKKIISMIFKSALPFTYPPKNSFDPEEIIPFFLLVQYFSKRMDLENHEENMKYMLECLFHKISSKIFINKSYKKIITEFTKDISPENIKDMAIIFDVPIDEYDYILGLGYNIFSVDNNGNSVLMSSIIAKNPPEMIQKIIDYGIDVNYQNPQNGQNALSCALLNLPKIDFRDYLDYQKKIKKYDVKANDFIKMLIALSSSTMVDSDSVRNAVYTKIKPGFEQFFYNDIMKCLSEKGLTVSDEYFKASIDFLERYYSNIYAFDKQDYLKNLYDNFSNFSIESRYPFPNIEVAKKYKKTTMESNALFQLVSEHLDRNFVTSPEQCKNRDEKSVTSYDIVNDCSKSKTVLDEAKEALLTEIMRYIGNLKASQILKLVDKYPMLDINMLVHHDNLLSLALNANEECLSRGLMQRGASIVYYDKNGCDVTKKLFDRECINKFLYLGGQHKQCDELHDLLADIGDDSNSSRKKINRE